VRAKAIYLCANEISLSIRRLGLRWRPRVRSLIIPASATRGFALPGDDLEDAAHAGSIRAWITLAQPRRAGPSGAAAQGGGALNLRAIHP